MGTTRRSGNTAGEALPLQFHIVGPQKSVGPFFGRRALAPGAGFRRRRPHQQLRRQGSYAAILSAFRVPTQEAKPALTGA
jgi:hypothetical protein